MKKIEIFGSGCRKCKRLEKEVRTAVNELGMQAEIEKVEDLEEITARGVMMTPALAIDGEIKSSGKLLSSREIKEILQS